jgi:hypothetical protein
MGMFCQLDFYQMVCGDSRKRETETQRGFSGNIPARVQMHREKLPVSV